MSYSILMENIDKFELNIIQTITNSLENNLYNNLIKFLYNILNLNNEFKSNNINQKLILSDSITNGNFLT